MGALIGIVLSVFAFWVGFIVLSALIIWIWSWDWKTIFLIIGLLLGLMQKEKYHSAKPYKIKPHIKLKAQPRLSQPQLLTSVVQPIVRYDILRIIKAFFWISCCLYWAVCIAAFLETPLPQDNQVAGWLAWLVMFIVVPLAVYGLCIGLFHGICSLKKQPKN
ncbi:hypothetical protein CRG49_001630 [Neisseria sp. N95_16]|uniref:Uncharacterized protein n=1 Tax=Neisseria brasiliensis TaxID=2666100 RepID=A0A7X2KXK0_9NEIS|nr:MULTISPECIES: hypothetical protein [Neisseria]MRN37039.1 hypothetical protein [Neisseria brasiliensis]PJO10592.1 hypothetical protein CRG49_001630 [Neisseria sp. N95_16]